MPAPSLLNRSLSRDQNVLRSRGAPTKLATAQKPAPACPQIVDRSKDVIKSGGEWISSQEVENEAVSHPQVAGALPGVQAAEQGRMHGRCGCCPCCHH